LLSRWIEFERLISQTLEIAYYVTCLHFNLQDIDSLDLEHCDSGANGVARTLSSLTRLKSLTLSTPHYISWKHLTITIKKPLLNLMHQPTLSRLRLDGFVDFQLSDLTLCVGLKHIEVAFCNTEVGSSVEIYQEEPSRLKSFGGVLSSRALLQLCTSRRTDGKPIVDATRLRKLRLDIDKDCLDDTEKTLKYLTHLISFEMLGCEALLHSSSFPNLFLPCHQTLHYIHLGIFYSSNFPLVSIFASMTGKNVIESIKLSMKFLVSSWDSNINDVWNALDQIFTQSSGWKELRSVSLRVQVRYLSTNQMVDANKLAEELRMLPETRLKGMASSKRIMLDLHSSSCLDL